MEEENKNILLKKVPERMSNIAKGILLLFPAVFISGLTWLILGMTGFCGDMACTENNFSSWANFVAGFMFLLFLIGILRLMFRPIKINK